MTKFSPKTSLKINDYEKPTKMEERNNNLELKFFFILDIFGVLSWL